MADKRIEIQDVADIIRDAGGRIVGRTRLQKLAYLLELSGLGRGFTFSYHHYGPYSEQLSAATRNAALLGLLKEEEHATSWGGFYSIYTASGSSAAGVDAARQKLAQQAASADPILLELAATAAFLSSEGVKEPWEMTAKLKPEKAEQGNLDKARALYRQLVQIETPRPLPNIG